MSTQLKSKSEPTAREAAANVDAKKQAMLERPKVIATGKGVGASGSVMFDSVPTGFKVANQVAVIIDMYYDLIGDSHRYVTIQELCDYAEDHHPEVFEVQGLAAVINHYQPEIKGDKAWKHKQGQIKIGSFK
tara:strand:- start:64 stop:459 length:396 start_codon:yes stop_codon:yes gene_type:complete